MLKFLEIEKKDGYYWTSQYFKGSGYGVGFENLGSAVWFILMGRI